MLVIENHPATGEILGSVPEVTIDDVENAIIAAKESQWPSFPASERSKRLRKWFELIIRDEESLAEILHLENGKTKAEALGEVRYAASFVEWFAEEARRTYGDTHPPTGQNGEKRLSTIYQPVGVCALITPWNFPAAMITRKQAAALAVGCTTITKPSELTPLTAIALTALAEEAGIPLDAVSLLTTTNAKLVGDLLCSSEDVAKVSFTGSTAVGKKLLAACAATVKRTSMELGGNAPLIVFEDADVEHAVQQTLLAKFRGAGQTCVCANRIFVHEKIFDEFAAKLAEGASKMTLGPLTSFAQFTKVRGLLEDALSKGAKVVGGQSPKIPDLPSGAKGGFHFPAVVLDLSGLPVAAASQKDNPADARVLHEEIFGPIAALQKFSSEREVLKRANASRGGLAGYFFSQDAGRCIRVAEGLKVGMVGVNSGVVSHPEAPFGGVKESGLGREGSRLGWLEYVDVKLVATHVPPAPKDN